MSSTFLGTVGKGVLEEDVEGVLSSLSLRFDVMVGLIFGMLFVLLSDLLCFFFFLFP
jgi:hypothetical protein